MAHVIYKKKRTSRKNIEEEFETFLLACQRAIELYEGSNAWIIVVVGDELPLAGIGPVYEYIKSLAPVKESSQEKEQQERYRLHSALQAYRKERLDIDPQDVNVLVVDREKPLWIQRGIKYSSHDEVEVFTIGIDTVTSHPLRRAQVEIMIEQLQSILVNNDDEA